MLPPYLQSSVSTGEPVAQATDVSECRINMKVLMANLLESGHMNMLLEQCCWTREALKSIGQCLSSLHGCVSRYVFGVRLESMQMDIQDARAANSRSAT